MRTHRLIWGALTVATPPLIALYVSCRSEPPVEGICFDEHVVPLLRRDCAPCHTNGEFNIKLQGNVGDYERLLDEERGYVRPGNPDGSILLFWADGLNDHPPLWSISAPESPEHRTIATWIREGASRRCGSADADADADAEEDGEEDSEADLEGDREADLAGDAEEDSEADLDEDSEESTTVSFASDIVPLLRFDCRPCHYAGMNGIQLNGVADDYVHVMRYVDVDDPEGFGGFLWWSAGGAGHPTSTRWRVGGSSYDLFLQWALEGALDN